MLSWQVLHIQKIGCIQVAVSETIKSTYPPNLTSYNEIVLGAGEFVVMAN